jgi:CHASE3 domain sensor protein
MNRLSIRLKITLWYSLLTVILLTAFLPVLYELISTSMYTNEEGTSSQYRVTGSFELRN